MFTLLNGLRGSLFLWTAWLSLASCSIATASTGDSVATWVQPILERTDAAQQLLDREYAEKVKLLQDRLHEIKEVHLQPESGDPCMSYDLLLERLQLKERLHVLEEEYELRELELRYRRGIEIVKMLYEKILAMDHHFSSLKTQQELLNISNPHFYPDFADARASLDERIEKKFGFTFPDVLQANPYLSATYSLIGMLFYGNDAKAQKSSSESITCILDFTVRMYTDLNTVYYETGYLRDANLTLKKDCEMLFADCARQVGYTIPLQSCRDSDDWERLYALLAKQVDEALQPKGSVEQQTGTAHTPDFAKMHKTRTNLKFALERITHFITRYSGFVNQGNEYYKKFAKIVESYQGDVQCNAYLPEAFHQLDGDIHQTLDKFNIAYRLPEVQGSKLKEMLYGVMDNR